MKLKVLIGLIALLVIGSVAAYTFKVGTFTEEIDDGLADKITADVAESGKSLDETIGEFYLEKIEAEYMSDLQGQCYRLTEKVVLSNNATLMKQFISDTEDLLGIVQAGEAEI